MRKLIDRFRSEYSPVKFIALMVCIAAFIAVLVFIGMQVFPWLADGAPETAAVIMPQNIMLGSVLS